jgi:hypothetical protein
MTHKQIVEFSDLLLAIRRARAAFIASGRGRPHWDSLAAAIRRDFHSGVDLVRITRMIEAWRELLARPVPRGLTYVQPTKSDTAMSAAKE